MNTDWNSPQGDFDTAEKQGELLMLLSRQQVTVHTWDDPDFDYMEEQDLALVVQSPSGTEDLLIELCGEFSVFFEISLINSTGNNRLILYLYCAINTASIGWVRNSYRVFRVIRFHADCLHIST